MSRYPTPWWYPSRLWRPVRRTYSRLTLLARWLPVLWNDADWDFSFILRVMEHKLKRHAVYFEEHGHLVNSHRYVREQRIAAELCKRIIEDNYIFVHGRDPQDWEVAKPFGESGYLSRLRHDDPEQRDLDYLCHFIRRKAMRWWD